MGNFWEKNPPEKYQGGGKFLSAEETEQLLDSGTVIDITGVREDDGKFGKRYLVDLNIEGEAAIKSFTIGSVQTRDKLLADMLTYFEANGTDPVKVKFVRWGAATGIEQATA